MSNNSSVNLTDLISYQPGTVISRELVNRPTGTVTLFAFDINQGLSEHTAPFDAFVQALDGQANITIGADSYSITTGEYLILPSSIPHSVKALSPFKMLLTMIRS